MKRKLSYWLGCVVHASDGDIGTVKQFYFDDLTWTIRYMVVQTGTWLTGRQMLIPMAALGKPKGESRKLPVSLTREQVRNSPNIDTAQPVVRQHEVELYRYYAFPGYWGGGFYGASGYGLSMPFPIDVTTKTDQKSLKLRKVDPHLRSTQEVTGYHIHATDGDIGHVEDFVVDEEAWNIPYLIVNTGNWLAGRSVLVSPQWIQRVNWLDKSVFVDLTRDVLKTSPEFDSSKPVRDSDENKLLAHLRKPNSAEWVVFKHHAPPEAEVYLAGTFNNWDSTAIRMDVDDSGIYTTTMLLPVGRYEYKFIVNGEWLNGPEDKGQIANDFGTANSVLVVSHTKGRKGRLHTFSRLPLRSKRRSHLWSTPAGG